MTDEARRQQIEALYAQSKPLFPDVPDVTPDQLGALQDAGPVVLVDVRSPAEQAVSMIPHALTAREFEAASADHAGATVVVYCTVGHRSGLYARTLRAKGWNTVNLKGAILAWTHAGRPLEGRDGPTRQVHVYNPRYNLVATGYEPVW